MGCGASNNKPDVAPMKDVKEGKLHAENRTDKKNIVKDWVGGERMGPARDASGKLDLDAARQYATAGKEQSKAFDPSTEYGPNGNIGAFAEEVPLPEHYVPAKMVMHNKIWIDERVAELHSDYRQRDITNEVARGKQQKESRRWCPYCRRLYPDQCICDDGFGEEDRRERDREARRKASHSKSLRNLRSYSPPASHRSAVRKSGNKWSTYSQGVGGSFLARDIQSGPPSSRSRDGVRPGGAGMVNWRTMTPQTIEKYNMRRREESPVQSPLGSPVGGRQKMANVTSLGVRAGEWLSDPDSD